ncbi:hypothetical protein RLO149_c040540 [Roseobacter litoralis Och 149]|uniref:Uncharacterized protein n=1 Tax=Roseobacter litoralis (strain ATCC 49566 / DSM 6996 / JCM 21268 / NBRC 15278 / OCh 149) TaxID=391595 RepID=F7ZFE5_ROSLO|nr:hypothetical protein RLO149_c040540 [Roseobacter litoralis Och 149]
MSVLLTFQERSDIESQVLRNFMSDADRSAQLMKNAMGNHGRKNHGGCL